MRNHLDIFKCPACDESLNISGGRIVCTNCEAEFPIEDGIPLLFLPNEWDETRKDVTDIVKAFYEETPFPNYEDMENVYDLMKKAEQGIFARFLNEQLPFNIRVLDVGCGTGQLSNFLSVAQRFVFGTDMCLNSLKLGNEFKNREDLKRVGFYQMNLFRPIFKKESFDVVICNGVLHHTANPYLGFTQIAELVKKNGYLIIGLYNLYGRLYTDLRRFIFKLFNNRFLFLDSRLEDETLGESRKLAWLRDQYKHPHESKHTIGETLKWFDDNGYSFVNSIPKAKALEIFTAKEKLFKPHSRGSWLDHLIVQLQLVFTGAREGGFYVMIGRKKTGGKP